MYFRHANREARRYVLCTNKGGWPIARLMSSNEMEIFEDRGVTGLGDQFPLLCGGAQLMSFLNYNNKYGIYLLSKTYSLRWP